MGKNYLKNKNQFKKTSLLGFTIVELLVVIVVIGILAAISVVSYSGIAQKARETALISDLTNAKTTLQMYQVENGSYPTSININDGCPIPADARFCLKPSTGINFSSYYNPGGDKQKFIIGATRDSVAGTVTDSTSPSISSVQSIPVAFTANGVGRNGSIQSWTVPTTGTYIIEAWAHKAVVVLMAMVA